MIYKLDGKTLSYKIDENGRSISFYNKLTGHEYIYEPDEVWKIIYADHFDERTEIPIFPKNQKAKVIQNPSELIFEYSNFVNEEGTLVDASMILHFHMTEAGIKVIAQFHNRDASVQITELQITPVAGARSLSGIPEEDYLAWPADLGKKFKSPAYSDLSVYSGFRKYERHDQFHTDMDALYQGGQGAMQWYDWYNKEEGLYIASEDTTRQAVELHVERNVKLNTLKFGIIRYPMIEKDEHWSGEAIDCFPHRGDWHTGSKIYRNWMNGPGGFTIPQSPEWCKEFTGWLRVILKQHHGELNWNYSDIPALYDETENAGFNTIFLLGWEEGGFARMWPDYKPDNRMGGKEKLMESIEYVHHKGGRVILFVSYALIDHQSNFYKKDGGDQATIKSIWQEEIPFAETYCGEGTYRKIGNPAMPMYLACPGAPMWQDKMKEAAKICIDLGADGVLYDIGGMKPYFCYANNHTHAKPSHSHEHKAQNYSELRKYIQSLGENKIILMENNVDIYGQSMDISQGFSTQPDDNLLMPELYRYTFPELVMTNRECGEDEVNFKAKAGYSFLYGLRFDMTIYRCCGSFRNIPVYTEYLKYLNALYKEYAAYIIYGTFVDTDGFNNSNSNVYAKGWRNKEGGMAVTLWNPTAQDQKTVLTCDGGQSLTVIVPAETATAIALK